MSNPRAPLSSIPNAANSPYRTVAAAASKRSRGEAGLQEDLVYDGQRPLKRQILETKTANFRTPPQRQPLLAAGDGVFGKRSQNKKPTAFERKLLAAKDSQESNKVERPTGEALEGIRTWQKHYRRVFPLFVFYFESVSDDVRSRCARHIRSLGAVSLTHISSVQFSRKVIADRRRQREEKFFSKEVTHVVTTRAIPSDSDSSPTELDTSSKATSSQTNSQPRTINPSLLNKPAGSVSNERQQTSSKSPLEPSTGKRLKCLGRSAVESEPRKSAVGGIDVLQRAQSMGMKIWQVEKLQRVINTMNEDPAEPQTNHGRNVRGVQQAAGGRPAREDLSHMLRKEQRHGPSDTVTTEDMVSFRGYYVYVRDIDEKTKPILVKEFAKPPRNESGDWPQFRANNPGKCPFVEDHSVNRQDFEKLRQQEQVERARLKMGQRAAPRTRAETALENTKAAPKPAVSQRQPLVESKNAVNKTASAKEKLPILEFCAPPIPVSANRRSPRKAPAEPLATVAPRLFGGEPAASGLQPSNVTSAIRSQMISSTAAAPGAKAGTSKEVHELKRKVLEKNSVPTLRIIKGPSVEPARAEHAIPVTRQSRRRAQERLVHIEEESTQSADDEDVWRAEEVTREAVVRGKCIKAKPKDPKPGYCENCREKYDDFEEVSFN